MSIDIFRGLTVLMMVFVDNLDFVKGLPWWTYHMPRQANGMTYVDMVYPAFLFVMGMSLPLSVARRSARRRLLRENLAAYTWAFAEPGSTRSVYREWPAG